MAMTKTEELEFQSKERLRNQTAMQRAIAKKHGQQALSPKGAPSAHQRAVRRKQTPVKAAAVQPGDQIKGSREYKTRGLEPIKVDRKPNNERQYNLRTQMVAKDLNVPPREVRADTSQYDNFGTGHINRRARIQQGSPTHKQEFASGITSSEGGPGLLQTQVVNRKNTNPEFENLGKFGGDVNIYGKSDTPGGPMNNFVGKRGAGGSPLRTNTTDPYGTGSTAAQKSGDVYGTKYDNADPYGKGSTAAQNSDDVYGTQYDNADPYANEGRRNELRTQFRSNARADGKTFGGGAGDGSGVLNQVASANLRGRRAFQQAMAAGLNSKAAARAAEAELGGISELVNADKNMVGRDTNQVGFGRNANDAEGNNIMRDQNALIARGQDAQLRMNENTNYAKLADRALQNDRAAQEQLANMNERQTKEYIDALFPQQFDEDGEAVGNWAEHKAKTMEILGKAGLDASDASTIAAGKEIAQMALNFEEINPGLAFDPAILDNAPWNNSNVTWAQVTAPGSRVSVTKYLGELIDQFPFMDDNTVIDVGNGNYMSGEDLFKRVRFKRSQRPKYIGTKMDL